MKGFNEDVYKDCGNSASILLNQLVEWFKSTYKKKGVPITPDNKIYRSSKQLSSDVVVLSARTIERAKKRLVDKGYIELSFVEGFYRVTHFSLTQKTLDLFAKELDLVEQPKLDQVKLADKIQMSKEELSAIGVCSLQVQVDSLQSQSLDTFIDIKNNQSVEALEEGKEKCTSFIIEEVNLATAKAETLGSLYPPSTYDNQVNGKKKWLPREEYLAEQKRSGGVYKHSSSNVQSNSSTPIVAKAMQEEFKQAGVVREDVVQAPFNLREQIAKAREGLK